MALYHPENWIRCKVRHNFENFPPNMLSCFEYDGAVYMSIKENDARKDIRICNAPEEYFGIKSPDSHPFIVTIGE
ncbi:hypothetical protein HON86_03620 [Candidatus Woesearchaeota archaeon]|nr:hypothetical protein [Candidatus Woesearchaeota archaeon]MBT4835672.1 hypothetical protein [Candidatus Woesearchaeota archaeon]MBT7169466.1 hypothetical protein [Candidatus Woesearchaeota archaeon]MBT7474676.1 hypothetical protein [Candidatus Woesearchaeota archaeon]